MKQHAPMKHQKLVAKQGKDHLIDDLRERIKELEKELESERMRKQKSYKISPSLIQELLEDSSELTIDGTDSVLFSSVRLNMKRTRYDGKKSNVHRICSVHRVKNDPQCIDAEIEEMRRSLRFLWR